MLRRTLSLFALASLTACVGPALNQEAIEAGALPPIDANYRDRLATSARRLYPDRALISNPRISDPVLIRDSSGRLLWLVCLEVDNRMPGAPRQGIEYRAYGFSPTVFTAPLQRAGSSLVASYCTERPLAWKPFPQLLRG